MRPSGPCSSRRSATRSPAPSAGSLDAVLTGLGWLEMLDAEPRDAIDIVFNALGATNGSASALDDVVVSALGRQPQLDLAVLLPTFAEWQPPGHGRRRSRIGAGSRDHPGRDRPRIARRVPRADPMRAWSRSRPRTWTPAPYGASTPTPASTSCASKARSPTATRLDAGAWDSAVALGRRAVAHQIAGASRAMLGLAREHASERVQFGRPIARFQAVRHRLAEALVAVEALEATLAAAADEPNPVTAALAKAVAGRTARTVGGALPAGARRDRLHHRASVPPVPEADDGARRHVRNGGRRSRSTSDGSCSRRAASRP